MTVGLLQAVQCDQGARGLVYGLKQLHLGPVVVESGLCDASHSLTSAASAVDLSLERL